MVGEDLYFDDETLFHYNDGDSCSNNYSDNCCYDDDGRNCGDGCKFGSSSPVSTSGKKRTNDDDVDGTSRTATPFHNPKCTGRGRQRIEPLSIMELKWPEIIVQSRKTEIQGKGRGRLLRSADQYRAGRSLSAFVGEPDVTNSFGMTGVATATVPLNKVLSTANERFKLYDTPKRNPARKCSELDVKSFHHFPPLPGSVNNRSPQSAPAAVAAGNSAQTNGNVTDDTPCLPSATAHTQPTHPDGADVEETTLTFLHKSSLSDNLATITTQSDSEADSEGQLKLADSVKMGELEGDVCKKTPCDALVVNKNPGIAESLQGVKDDSGSDCGSPLLVNQSTPKPPQKVNPLDWADDSNRESSHHTIRIENMPLNITRHQLEEVLAPYGQVLSTRLELRISGGEEMLAAEVEVADGSIAEFIASCLDDAETMFEGSHQPVRCYIK